MTPTVAKRSSACSPETARTQNSSLLACAVKYPLLTLGHLPHPLACLLLWLKRVPWFAKSANRELQQRSVLPSAPFHLPAKP
jgi:hypothetical protein